MIVDPSFIPCAIDKWRSAKRNPQSRWLRVILAIKPDGDDPLECLIKEIDRNPIGIHDVLRRVTGENPTKAESRGDWVKLGEDWKEWWKSREKAA